MNEIQFGGQLTEVEFASVSALAARKQRFAVGVFGAVLAVFLVSSFSREQISEQPLAFIFTLFFIFIFIGGGWPLRRLLLRRYWRNNKILQKPVHGSVSDEAITWNVEGLLSSRTPWDLFLKHRASPSMILVYVGLNQVYYFPRRYFHSDSDWTEFYRLVAAKVPPK